MLSFPRGTEMFQFTRFPLPALCVQTGVTPHDGCRVSPFGHPRIKACSAAPRGFSQPPTSFIGSRRQGIHRWLFVAWKNKDARARYAILKGLTGARRAPGTTSCRLEAGSACPRCARQGPGGRRTGHRGPGGTPSKRNRERTTAPPHPPGDPKIYNRWTWSRRPSNQCINWVVRSLARPRWLEQSARANSLERR